MPSSANASSSAVRRCVGCKAALPVDALVGKTLDGRRGGQSTLCWDCRVARHGLVLGFGLA